MVKHEQRPSGWEPAKISRLLVKNYCLFSDKFKGWWLWTERAKPVEAPLAQDQWHCVQVLWSVWSATREKSSGQNENDVLKLAHQIFYNNQKKKFNLEHAWRELRHDQKWCDLATAKNEGTSKKRKCDDGADSSTSQATANKHPPGVKSAKASGKKKVVDENAVNK